MRRVLLSPNVVFESSRSSIAEPKTVGPSGAQWPAPDLDDALGRPIRIALSSILLEYLVAKGSVLVSPVVTRRWAARVGCSLNVADCAPTTWVERLLLLSRSEEQGGIADLPTAAFAVREMGIGVVDIDVVVQELEGNRLRFAARTSSADPSICGRFSLTVPVVSFSAELVSMKDGRLLARIDERRLPILSTPLQTTITLNEWTAVYEDGFSRTLGGGGLDPASKYQYVALWKEGSVACTAASAAFDRLRASVLEEMNANMADSVTQVLGESLDRLFRNSGEPASAREDSPPR